MVEVIAAAFARSVQQVICFDPGVRLGDDPEDLHQFRVATRRLRSDLRTFGPLLDATWTKALRDELRWLDVAVGAVRDADVLLLRLVDRLSTLATSDAAAGRRLRQELEARRVVGRACLSEEMNSDRYLSLLATFVSAATAPRVASDKAGLEDEVARTHLAALARKPWRRLNRAVDALTPEPSDDEMHRVRTLAKRCRYCADAAAPVLGGNAERFADRLADLQTVLGDHHDTVLAEAWLRGEAKLTPSIRFDSSLVRSSPPNNVIENGIGGNSQRFGSKLPSHRCVIGSGDGPPGSRDVLCRRAGDWVIDQISPVIGDSLASALRLAITSEFDMALPSSAWALAGFTSNERYVDARDRASVSAQSAISRPCSQVSVERR